MKKLFIFFRQNVSFLKSESNGFLVLLGILFLLIALPYWWTWQFPKTQQADIKKLDSLMAFELKNKAKNKKPKYDNDDFDYQPKSKAQPISYTNFDPNTATESQLKSLGLSSFAVNNLIKYRTAGAKIKSAEDFKKIYGIDETTFEKLKPYIEIGTTTTNFTENKTTEKAKFEPKTAPKIAVFDINTADTTQLIALKGIGSTLANRIIKYKNALGGFYSKNQIDEIYGLDSLAKAELIKYTHINEDNLTKININQVTNLKHPYLKPYLAKAILAYKTEHGNFKKPEDLLQIKIMDAKTLQRITPYLTF